MDAIDVAGANLYPPDGWRSDSDARSPLAGAITQSFDCELPVFWHVAGQVDRGRLIPGFFMRASSVVGFQLGQDLGALDLGMPLDANDNRAHGRDERIRTRAFHSGLDYFERLVPALTSAGSPAAAGR
jgi:hypothetical protein